MNRGELYEIVNGTQRAEKDNFYTGVFYGTGTCTLKEHNAGC
jgi:hypothetical protein